MAGVRCVSWGPGRLDIFARGRHDTLWHQWREGDTWGEWESLGGSLRGDPEVATRRPGSLDIFALSRGRVAHERATGNAHDLWSLSFDGRWSDWRWLSGSEPRPQGIAFVYPHTDVASLVLGHAPNAVELAGVVADGRLATLGSASLSVVVQPPGTGLSPVHRAGGGGAIHDVTWPLSAHTPAIAGWPPLGTRHGALENAPLFDRIYYFARRAADGMLISITSEELVHQRPWRELGVRIAARPVALSHRFGDAAAIALLAQSTDNRLIWGTISPEGHSFETVDIAIDAPPAIASDGTRLHAVARGGGQGLWHVVRDGADAPFATRWLHGPESIAPPALCSTAPGHLDLVVRTDTDQVYFLGYASQGDAWDQNWQWLGADLTAPPVPRLHRSIESDERHGLCDIQVELLAQFGFRRDAELGRLLPEWESVFDVHDPVILEGTVVTSEEHDQPHISFTDWPFSHFTHDFTFFVEPDKTADDRFTNLLGIRVDPDTGEERRQTTMEVEWETGLGAYNPSTGNPAAPRNLRGDSGGLFTAGHRRRGDIWQWPTWGDWVHVEGVWIFDRGHPPAVTEIHPPRLVATRRRLPLLHRRPDGSRVFATRVDLFASGDGGALRNNRRGVPGYVERVRMSEKDYEFDVAMGLDRPSGQTPLVASVHSHRGDSFPMDLDVQLFPDGTDTNPAPHAHVRIPWRSGAVSDRARVARSVFLYWDEGLGVAHPERINLFRVTLDKVSIKKIDEVWQDKFAEFRIFVEVGGHWRFVNELHGTASDILNAGLGATGVQEWGINQSFIVSVPEGLSFRVHASGWESNASGYFFGALFDPLGICFPDFHDFVNETLFTLAVRLGGCGDDPIGEVNDHFVWSSAPGHFATASSGEPYDDQCHTLDPDGTYVLHYRIQRAELPPG